MPGSRRIYVHIGEPKTGTSFLQHALWSNRAHLAAQGVVLPGYSYGGHARASQDLREVRWQAGDPADPWVGEWDVLTGQALRAGDAAVISNELLVACNPRQADRAVQSLLPAEQLLDIALRATAALADHQQRGDIITGNSDLTVGMHPARRQQFSRLGLTILRQSRIKRMLYQSSNRPTVRSLRILAWRILARPGRRHA